MARRHWYWLFLLTVQWSLITGLTGCEALQRKFTRKPKHAGERPTPIIQFKDYSGALTPLDRYQKHYMLFDYWNSQLLAGIDESRPNPKRLKRDSAESLNELVTLQGLMADDLSQRLEPMVKDRRTLDRTFQSGAFNPSRREITKRELEAQTGQFQKQFFWRDVEDHLNP